MASHPITHGGQALAFARERQVHPRDVLDFSANINPLGPAPSALAAIRKSLDVLDLYPDEMSSRLTSALSKHLQISAENILPGNGATELLHFWLRTIRPRTATLIVPTFSEYRRGLEGIGATVETIQLHQHDHFRLPSITAETDAVIVTNPDNPTGAFTPPEEMIEWVARQRPTTHVFIDEAFIEFTAQPSLVRYIDRFPYLWVLRSMTKFFAMPGLRLGYLAGSGIPTLTDYREPWQVNTLAEAAGVASLEDTAYQEKTMQLIQRERLWLWKQLRALQTVRAFPTAANFFFAACENDAQFDRLIATLRGQNMLVRDCRGVEGLEGAAFRFAIRTRAENTKLLGHLRSS